MHTQQLNVVTGAAGFTGKYIAQQLLSRSERVITLTGQISENPFGGGIQTFPYNFGNPLALEENLRGVNVLYNTYWIRFPRGEITYDLATKNTKRLVDAAVRAGVLRIVHISITNPSPGSPLPYFRGKALVEKSIKDSGLSYAIVRPAVIFGPEDILINNIAWMLRKFPAFGIIGSGEYRIRPIFVEDLAKLTIDAAHDERNTVIDAVGPETFTFNELTKLIAEKIGARPRIIHMPACAGYLCTRLIGLAVGDLVLTKDEIRGLTDNLLVTERPATGHTRLSDYLERNRHTIGTRYASELKRHYR